MDWWSRSSSWTVSTAARPRRWPGAWLVVLPERPGALDWESRLSFSSAAREDPSWLHQVGRMWSWWRWPAPRQTWDWPGWRCSTRPAGSSDARAGALGYRPAADLSGRIFGAAHVAHDVIGTG